MDVKWEQDGDRHTAYFTGSSITATFYPLDGGSWRWEIRQRSDLIRCGTRPDFVSAKDAAFSLMLKDGDE